MNEGRERFLAHTIQHAIEVGRRTSQDFIRHFPPSLIMEGLKDHPALRAGILVPTIGVKERVALKKSWRSSSEDLQIALEEGETDAESIVELFELEDRVRFLDHEALWQFVTEGDFWKTKVVEKEVFSAAKSHIAFMMERGLEDQLLTHDDIVSGISVQELSIRLPKEELGKIIQGALERGRSGGSFTERDLLAAMPPALIVAHVPLEHIWNTVIGPHIAARHGYAAKEDVGVSETPATKDVAADVGAPTPANDTPRVVASKQVESKAYADGSAGKTAKVPLKPKAEGGLSKPKTEGGPPRRKLTEKAVPVAAVGDFEDTASWAEQLGELAIEDDDFVEEESAVGT